MHVSGQALRYTRTYRHLIRHHADDLNIPEGLSQAVLYQINQSRFRVEGGDHNADCGNMLISSIQHILHPQSLHLTPQA